MLVPRCRDAAGAAWQQFREQWAQLHALSRARRFEALASLQPLAELEVLGSNLTVHAFYFSSAGLLCRVHERLSQDSALQTMHGRLCWLMNAWGMQEALEMVRSRDGRPAVIDMSRLAGRWRERWPSAQQPSADACLSIVNSRDLLLQALSQEAAKSSALPHNVSADPLTQFYLLISRQARLLFAFGRELVLRQKNEKLRSRKGRLTRSDVIQ